MANSFDVLKAMAESNGKIQLAPLSNILRMHKVKAGTQLTIGVGGDVITGLTFGEFVGGLILADKTEFDATAARLDKEAADADPA
jgi:hypothetical protein